MSLPGQKTHSDKNVLVAAAKTKRVVNLSQTYPGKTHDKKVADTEAISYPENATLHKDTGFQGYEPQVRETRQPKKASQQGTDRRRKTQQS